MTQERSIHRFIGPDYPLVDTFPYPDDVEASLEVQEDLRRQNSVYFGSRHISQKCKLEMTQPNEAMFTVAVEEFDTPGHRVPTGLTSERQMWVEGDFI